MGLWDKLLGEFVDVIQWTDDSNDTLVYRFERYGNEIKYGAMLTVRDGQVAVVVNEGQLADVFQPGLYKLETSNLPILSTLQSWQHGFESPFKAEVYFFNTRRFTDLKWGTKNPVMRRDPEFGPVRLRAYGAYAVRIRDAATFLKEIVGTDGRFTTAVPPYSSSENFFCRCQRPADRPLQPGGTTSSGAQQAIDTHYAGLDARHGQLIPAGEVVELGSLFANVPPPLSKS